MIKITNKILHEKSSKNYSDRLDHKKTCSDRSLVGQKDDSTVGYHYNLPCHSRLDRESKIPAFAWMTLILIIFSSFLFAEEKETIKQDSLRRYQLEGIRVIAEKPQESIGSFLEPFSNIQSVLHTKRREKRRSLLKQSNPKTPTLSEQE